jgi:hypothetical protein
MTRQGYVVRRIKVDGKNKIEEDEVWEGAMSFSVDDNNNLSLFDDNQRFMYQYHAYNWSGIGPWPTDE